MVGGRLLSGWWKIVKWLVEVCENGLWAEWLESD